VVCALLMWIFAFVYFNFWMVIYSTSAMPGPKLMNGIIFGVGESFSCLTSGLLVRFIKDSTAVIICCFVGVVTASTFYFTGGMETGLLGAILLFTEVFAIGAICSLTYVLAELRVPPESFGSTTVLCVTLALIFSGLSQFFAYADGIIPTATVVLVFCLIAFMTIILPPGGQFLQNVNKINASCSQLLQDPNQMTINDSAYMVTLGAY